MKKKSALTLIALFLLVGFSFGIYQLWWSLNYYSVEYTDYLPPGPTNDLKLVDDLLSDKTVKFYPNLVDSRLLEGGYQINLSAAIIKLDLPDMKPDREAELLKLRPAFSDALVAAKSSSMNFLPSANLLDGAAKQFDDGLYAAIDLAVYDGQFDFCPSLPGFLEQILNQLDVESNARAYIVAALQLADEKEALKGIALSNRQTAIMNELLDRFHGNALLSKPIGFYTWNSELGRVWQVGRFLQLQFDDDLTIPIELATVLRNDADLKQQYSKLMQFYARLTNPPQFNHFAQLVEDPDAHVAQSLSLMPGSSTRETELFNRLYPLGIPEGTNLMSDLIRHIRSGDVDLTPRNEDGWYSHQVFALETLLMPERGREGQKLLLTARYKKRLVEAFKSMISKRRETHARMAMAGVDSEAARRPARVNPRLRIEPCATFYLRTARAYAFLQNFLLSTLDPEKLNSVHGLTKNGKRQAALQIELEEIKNRFFGFYLLACEDIGLQDSLSSEELIDKEFAKTTATEWLETMDTNADLKQDSRISIPVFRSVMNNETHFWGTLGVRLVRVRANFATPPSIRPDVDAEFEQVPSRECETSEYVIAIDEFASFVVSGNKSFSREEFRAICNQYETKEAIVTALEK